MRGKNVDSCEKVWETVNKGWLVLLTEANTDSSPTSLMIFYVHRRVDYLPLLRFHVMLAQSEKEPLSIELIR